MSRVAACAAMALAAGGAVVAGSLRGAKVDILSKNVRYCERVGAPNTAVVVGAGISGVATAYVLASSGVRVTVVEKREKAAMSTSWGPAGLVTRSKASTIPNPCVSELMHLFPSPMKDADVLQYFRLDPKTVLSDVSLWRWGLRFIGESLAVTLGGRYEENQRQTFVFSHFAGTTMLDILEREGLLKDCLYPTGHLEVYQDTSSLPEKAALAAERSAVGANALETRDALDQYEPWMKNKQESILGGLHIRDTLFGDCHRTTNELARVCQEKYGVRFLYGTTVDRALIDDKTGSIKALATDKHGYVEGDVFIVSAGSESPDVVSAITERDVWIPIYSIKGYSWTVPYPSKPGSDNGRPWAPKLPIIDTTNEMYFVPLPGNRLRIATIGEFAKDGNEHTDEICNDVWQVLMNKYGFSPSQRESATQWMGCRPTSPDGWPILGAVTSRSGPKEAPQNLILHTGHGASGFKFGLGTAVILGEYLTGKRVATIPKDLDTSRLSYSRFNSDWK